MHLPKEVGDLERRKPSGEGWKWLLLPVGLAAMVWLIRKVGSAELWRAIEGAVHYLPIVVLLEGAFMSMDVFALRAIAVNAGPKVPWVVWVRSACAAYATMILLPGGRAAGEVARATQLARFWGASQALGNGMRLQAATMLANAFISLPSALACFFPSLEANGLALPWLVLGNGLLTALLGAWILWLSKSERMARWLGRIFPSFGQRGSELQGEKVGMALPIAYTCIGRVFQSVQYGTIVFALGGVAGIQSALVAQGIHLVGAAVGDLIPNQAGMTEGAYWLFGKALGFGSEPAKAVAIALFARLAQYILAALALVLLFVLSPFWGWKGERRKMEEDVRG
ncbi:MAG: lysylphosphatidylglycerol synthase transmembrane domain-containing protein [Sandaracinaceae bacterium]|nr:lysylphosphatidylglycerol synthase transmembrane domain-containing protein [Sandaracinaceae bacterium]